MEPSAWKALGGEICKNGQEAEQKDREVKVDPLQSGKMPHRLVFFLFFCLKVRKKKCSK